MTNEVNKELVGSKNNVSVRLVAFLALVSEDSVFKTLPLA